MTRQLSGDTRWGFRIHCFYFYKYGLRILLKTYFKVSLISFFFFLFCATKILQKKCRAK